MAKAKIMLISCPQGHSFITLQSFGHSFTCPECDQTFDDWFGGFEINRRAGNRRPHRTAGGHAPTAKRRHA